MLYSVQFQFSTFLIIFFVVFASSFLYDVSALIYQLTAKNNVVKNIFNFLATSVILIIFYLVVLSKNYGEMRWFCFLAAFLAIVIQRITFGKIIAKFYDLWYNAFEKIKQRINERQKSRHGKRKED
ncbi:MAG: spore cortex biosynthesis protein YabQ [Christensenellales bacterium]